MKGKQMLRGLLLSLSIGSGVAACEINEQLEFDAFCDSRGLYLCNASEPSCHEPLAEFVACLREKPLVSLPQIEVISEAEWRAEVTASVESESGQNFEHLVTGLELFDRFPSTRPTPQERIDSRSERILIERSANQIQLVDHGEGFSSRLLHLQLAGALTSSMLQQEYDYESLEALSEGDPSYRSAIANVLYGTTLLAANMVYSALEEESFWSSAWLNSFHSIEREIDTSLRDGIYGLERFTFRQAPLPTVFGQRAVHETWRRGQAAEVENLLEALPTSISALGDLAGVDIFTLWSPEYGEHFAIEGQPSLGNALASFEQVSDFVMGSWFTAYFLYRAIPESDDPFRDPPTSWLADRLWVFHSSSTNATAAMWLWAPSDDDEEWAQRIGDYADANNKPWRIQLGRVGGHDIVGLLACDAPATLPLWETELAKTLAAISLRPGNASSGP